MWNTIARVGGRQVDELRGNHGAEEYRAVLGLVRENRFQEALERCLEALRAGNLGRRCAARLNSLIGWLLCEPLGRPGPAAALHGEEAVRLAELVGDPWIRCEAQGRLVTAYVQLGDVARARSVCERLEQAVAQNPTVIDGGPAAVWRLRALVAAAEGDDAGFLAALERAEAESGAPAPDRTAERMRARRVPALLVCGRRDEAREAVAQSCYDHDSGDDAALEWGLARAWVALDQLGPAAALGLVGPLLAQARSAGEEFTAVQCLVIQALAEDRQAQDAGPRARQALQRAVKAGRVDLARLVRRRLAHLL